MKKAETRAAVIAILIGVPLIYVFAQAMAQGHARGTQAPLRAMLGDQAYETLASGRQTELNYMGNDRTAPDFTLRDQRGQPWRLSDHRGKVVIMNFWTITCQPCVEEMPTLVELADLLDGRDDVELVTITVDERWEEVRQLFPPDNKLTVLFDPEKSVVSGKFGTRLYPETWFIDPDGVIRLRVDGPRNWAQPVVIDAAETFL